MTASEPGPGSDVRLLGAALEQIPADERTAARFATVYHALGRRFDLVGNVRPSVPAVADYVNTLRNFHPRREGWRARAGFSEWRFRRRSESIERQLDSWTGRYDLIFQLQTLFAPGTRPADRAVHGVHRQHLLAHEAALSRVGAATGWAVTPMGRAGGR